ncbi:MAG: dockerin type I repeat-containing protein [Acutalibacteraceae bacterium]
MSNLKRYLNKALAALLATSLILTALTANAEVVAPVNRYNGLYQSVQGPDNFYFIYVPATYDANTKAVTYDFAAKEKCEYVQWQEGRYGWTKPGITDYAEMPFVYDDWVYLHRTSTQYAFGMEFVADRDGYYNIEAMVFGGDTAMTLPEQPKDWGDGFYAELIINNERVGTINTDNVHKALAGDYWKWDATDLTLKQSGFNLSSSVYLKAGSTVTLYMHAKTNIYYDSACPRMMITRYEDKPSAETYSQGYSSSYDNTCFKPVYADYDYTDNTVDMSGMGYMVYSEEMASWTVPNSDIKHIYNGDGCFINDDNTKAMGFEFTAPKKGVYDFTALAGGGDGYANPSETDPSLGDGYGVQVFSENGVIDKLSTDNVYAPLANEEKCFSRSYGRVELEENEKIFVMYTPLVTVWGDAIYPLFNVKRLGEFGDATDDGEINIIDIVRMKKYACDNSTEISFNAADINKDATIDASDIVEVRKMLLA